MHIIKNGRWLAATFILGIGAGVYYAFAIVWPTQVQVLYASQDDLIYIGWLSTIIGLGKLNSSMIN
jgi:hypothetical protein